MDSPSSSSKVLLVEGQDDKHVVRHLYSKIGLKEDFRICDMDGIVNLRDVIIPQIKEPGRNTERSANRLQRGCSGCLEIEPALGPKPRTQRSTGYSRNL